MLLWAAILAGTDLAAKALAEAVLSNAATIGLGPVNIRLLYNRGVAFSLGADLAPWIVIAATGLIIAALTWYAVSSAPAMTRLSRAGAALLLGGAAGSTGTVSWTTFTPAGSPPLTSPTSSSPPE